MKQGKTMIDHYPLKELVIVKRINSYSVQAILGSKDAESLATTRDISKQTYTVVAIGKDVDELELGDSVSILHQALLEEIIVNSNNKTYIIIKRFIQDNITELSKTEVFEIHDYLRCSSFAIGSIINRKRDDLNYDITTTTEI